MAPSSPLSSASQRSSPTTLSVCVAVARTTSSTKQVTGRPVPRRAFEKSLNMIPENHVFS